MAVKKIFISFDYDDDNELRGSFISEALTPFEAQIR